MAPVLEKFDLGTGVSSLSQLSLRSFYFHIGKKKKKSWCLPELWLCLWPMRSVTGREESSWQNLYQPISTTAWHGKTARHSSHRRSVSWLSLCLSGSSATSLLLIVTHLAARHDSAAWRRAEVEAMSKSSHCKLLCSHSRNVLRALNIPYYSHGFSEFLLLHLSENRVHPSDLENFSRGIRRYGQPETCTPVVRRASLCLLKDTDRCFCTELSLPSYRRAFQRRKSQ